MVICQMSNRISDAVATSIWTCYLWWLDRCLTLSVTQWQPTLSVSLLQLHSGIIVVFHMSQLISDFVVTSIWNLTHGHLSDVSYHQ